jgi:hypothetical protein
MHGAALIVGLNQDRGGRTPPITLAEGDAQAMFQRLQSLSVGQGPLFPKRRCTLLTGAQAAGRSIGLALAGIAPDLLLVYVSGAMRVDPLRPNDPFHLLTYDGVAARDISLRQLIDTCAAPFLVALLDVVLLGVTDESRTAAGLAALAPHVDALPAGYSLMAACSPEPAVKEPQGMARGAFTAALLQALRPPDGRDRRADELRVEDLARVARNHVLLLADRPPLLHFSSRGQVPPLSRRPMGQPRAASPAEDRDMEPSDGRLRCDHCSSPDTLGSLYCCEQCGALICVRCVRPIRRSAGQARRCFSCGGRLI